MSKKITELNAGTLKADSLFATAQSGAQPADPWTTTKISATALGTFLNTVMAFAGIGNKTVVEAIAACQTQKDHDTLEAGETTITFSGLTITSSSMIYVSVEDGLWYDDIQVDEVNGEVTLTFTAQADDIVVGIEIS